MSSNSSALPWFMHVAGVDMSDDIMYVWHQLTRLRNSREGLLTDPGAFDNLSGDRWVARMNVLAQKAGKRISYRHIVKP
eukprot:3055922-Karenia_brevis.AAC.1